MYCWIPGYILPDATSTAFFHTIILKQNSLSLDSLRYSWLESAFYSNTSRRLHWNYILLRCKNPWQYKTVRCHQVEIYTAVETIPTKSTSRVNIWSTKNPKFSQCLSRNQHENHKSQIYISMIMWLRWFLRGPQSRGYACTNNTVQSITILKIFGLVKWVRTYVISSSAKRNALQTWLFKSTWMQDYGGWCRFYIRWLNSLYILATIVIF